MLTFGILLLAATARADDASNCLLQTATAATQVHAALNNELADISSTGTSTLGPMYHTVQETFAAFESLASSTSCAVPFTTEYVQDPTIPGSEAPKIGKSLFVAHIGNPEAKKTMLLVANEHAREAITGELALNIAKWACVGGDSNAASLLSNVHIVMVPIANVAGRELIDSGAHPCQRYTADEGEGQIDINRQGDIDFEVSSDHGPAPFSTYQARILKHLAETHKPVAYLDLHSGAESLMTSWGDRDYVDDDYSDQLKLLSVVKNKYCPNCGVGSNKVVIGYDNPGELIDHMYAVQRIKYSTLWEVYDGASNDCSKLFNPMEQDRFDATISKWLNAVTYFVEYVNEHISEGEQSKPHQPRKKMALLGESTSRKAKRQTMLVDHLTT